jgi:hypothetical protein
LCFVTITRSFKNIQGLKINFSLLIPKAPIITWFRLLAKTFNFVGLTKLIFLEVKKLKCLD